MQQTAADYLARTHRRRTWKTVISVLACIVVFCTTYALILPAITMTDDNQVLDCSINIHQHTADCYDDEYNLICGEADFVIHTHDSSCFDAEGNLVCKLPEIEAHEHTNNCCRKES